MGNVSVTAGGRVHIEGLDRTLRALSKAGADSEDMKELMHEVGMLVVRAANPPSRTGRLAATDRAGRGKTKAVVRAGGARAKYAGVIHYGWPAHNIAPNPWLMTAIQGTRPQQVHMIDRGIGDLLRKNKLK